jgi:alpha-tubulin suppressor-like RCC1 family protein
LALLSLLTTGVSALGISAGGFHTCAVLNEGTVMCWGSNSNGQLGIGSTTGTLSPIAAHLGEGVLQFHNWVASNTDKQSAGEKSCTDKDTSQYIAKLVCKKQSGKGESLALPLWVWHWIIFGEFAYDPFFL